MTTGARSAEIYCSLLSASSFDAETLGEIITHPGGSLVPVVFQYGKNLKLLIELKVSSFALQERIMMNFLFLIEADLQLP